MIALLELRTCRGIWGALANVYAQAREQRCWNHHIVNVLDKVPPKDQATAKEMVTAIPYAETKEEQKKLVFQEWCAKKGYAAAGQLLDRNWERSERYKKVPNATAVIWNTLLVAEKSFRRLNAPELLAEVAAGAAYVIGVRITKGR